MIAAVPLTLVPLILFNVLGIVYGAATPPWDNAVFGLPLVAGVAQMTLGDLMVTLGIVMLFFEILKAARPGPRTIVNHLASTAVFVVYLIEVIVVGFAANATFLILTMLAVFDVAAGFTVSIRTSTRDIALGHTIDGAM